jgi:hypothetical protein
MARLGLFASQRTGLAMALYGMEKDGAAGAEARKALTLNSGSARAYLVLGLIASNKQDIASAKSRTSVISSSSQTASTPTKSADS